MLKRAIRRWLGINDAPAPVAVPTPDKPKPNSGYFSTALNVRPGIRASEDLAGYLQRTAGQVFQKTAADVPVMRATYAMDGAVTISKVMDDAGELIKGQFGFGCGGVPDAQIDWYAAQSFIGFQMCAILAQHWFIDKACTMPARDAIRNGYSITRDDGEKLDPKIVNAYKKLDKRFKIKANCVEAVRKARMFGIRVVLFEVNSSDPDYYLKPFNPDGITPGSYKGISQVDPYWITPELDFDASANPAGMHFYEPTWWQVSGKRYHRSHLIVLKTCEVADVLKPTYRFGGIPLPQRIYERIYAAERTANEAPQLALTKRSTYIHVDLEAAAANQQSLTDKLLNWRYWLDNYGVKVLGKEETAEQFDTALNDLDETIMTQFQLACSIAGVPATKMLGVQPKGFNATGEYEEASYHEDLESVQEHDMAPIIERHNLLCMRSYIVPKFKLNAPIELGVQFEDLDAETAKEKAERHAQEADSDMKWAQTGALDGIDIRNRLIADKDSPYTGIETAEPEGPRPQTVIDPNAPKTAPNTAPGQTPTPAPAVPAPPGGAPATTPAHDSVEGILRGLSAWIDAQATH